MKVGERHHAQEKGEPAVRQHDYLVLVGMLQWLTHTRPDVAYGVNLVARWSHNPGEKQWEYLRQLIRYIGGTRDAGIKLGGANEDAPPLRIYTDADHAGCLDTRRSTSGVVVQVFGSTVAQISKRQACSTTGGAEAEGVAVSTMEAELVALFTASKECERMERILAAFEVAQPSHIPIYCDNLTTVTKVTGRLTHEKTKWIDVALKYTRERQESGRIKVEWIPGTENVADLMTKPLPAPQIRELARQIGMVGI